MTVSVELMRLRLRQMEMRRNEYERRARANEGRLPLSDRWRHEYVSGPYLLGCPDDRLALRFRDVFINQTDLNREGKIGLLAVDNDGNFMRKFTHLLEEYGTRGGLPDLAAAKKTIARYFSDGGPIAARIFADYVEPPHPFLVKYGSRPFLEPMLREGYIRICPASYYNNTQDKSEYNLLAAWAQGMVGYHTSRGTVGGST